MLQLFVGSQELELGEIKGIAIKLKSSVFQFEGIVSSHSVPFSIPRTPHNEVIFKYHGSLDCSTYNNPYVATLYHSGIKIYTGNLNIKQSNDKFYDCDLRIDMSVIASEMKDKNIRDADHGGDVTFTFKSEYTRDNDGYTIFPVYNTNAIVGTPWENDLYTTVKDYMNFWDAANNRPVFQEPVDSHSCMNVIVPFPFLDKVIENVVNMLSVTLERLFLRDSEELKSLVIFNTNNACDSEYFYGYPAVKPVMNKVNIANHLPNITVEKFIKAITSFFCASVWVTDGRMYIEIRTITTSSTE
jgi:hypothetical protein